MAPIKLCILIATTATFASSVLGKEFMVGDDKGWTTNFDYQGWAAGKEFVVGYKLGIYIFIYFLSHNNSFSSE